MICDPKKDCFAYDPKNNDCKALNFLYCTKEVKCRFYKKEKNKVNSEPTDGYYKYRLQTYFDQHFGQYASEAEFYPDPTPHSWEFLIPSKEEIVTLKCSPVGRVSVTRRKVGKHGN